MFSLTFSMIPSVYLARYGVSRAKDLEFGDCAALTGAERKHFTY